MSRCNISPDSGSPVLNVRMVGRGEDAMCMEKRLSCAGRALGVRVKIDWRSDQYGEPVVYIGEKRLVDHLVQTTELEALLKPFIEHTNKET
ncbi:MAG TPA: hypothetical protein ENI98_09950 [Gammaproteobacteria bacterium]|nr:hypothetical protein [Gammaproteobacteria bacterium]